jgi:cobalt-zinc-cadmium efflux system outer membrane protein
VKRMQRIPWLMGIGFWLIAPLAAQFPARLTVEEAVRRAEANHAALAAARARVDIADGLLRQAGVHPNPVLAVLTENWRFYGTPDFAPADDLDITAALRQTFETGGKRDRRVAVARQDGTVASLERDAVAWELRQAVRRAFLRALLAGKLHELQAEQSAFFQQVIDYHQARVAEGVMAEADLVRVRLEGELLAAARDGAKLEADQARVELLRTMGETRFDTEFQLEDPGAGEPRLPPEETTLLALAVEHRLEIRLARAAATKAAAQLELEQALAKPDWELEAGYKRTGGFNTLVAGVSVPLPFFNRNLGGIAAAGAATRHADAQLRLAEAQVRADVAQAVDNLRRRHAILQRMHQGMLDWAEQSWNIALSAYREGGLDLLRLLEAHRTRNEVLNRHTQAEMEYRLGWVDLETAVGTEMSAGTGQ